MPEERNDSDIIVLAHRLGYRAKNGTAILLRGTANRVALISQGSTYLKVAGILLIDHSY